MMHLIFGVRPGGGVPPFSVLPFAVKQFSVDSAWILAVLALRVLTGGAFLETPVELDLVE